MATQPDLTALGMNGCSAVRLAPDAEVCETGRSDAVIRRTEQGHVMDDKEKLDRSGAYAWERLLDEEQEPPPEEFTNPPGVGRGECDIAQGEDQDPSCGNEITAQVQDFVLEETLPGYGIPGYEGEEDGGG